MMLQRQGRKGDHHQALDLLLPSVSWLPFFEESLRWQERELEVFV